MQPWVDGNAFGRIARVQKVVGSEQHVETERKGGWVVGCRVSHNILSWEGTEFLGGRHRSLKYTNYELLLLF